MAQSVALELKNVSKHFGSIIANKNVDLTVYKGEILAVLGENGSGKTTLMNMIAGIYFPDEGQIFVDGKEVVIRSPKDAFDNRIGMIHQHFKLVDVFTATENTIIHPRYEGSARNIRPRSHTARKGESIETVDTATDNYFDKYGKKF